jgi:hypothetical protein
MRWREKVFWLRVKFFSLQACVKQGLQNQLKNFDQSDMSVSENQIGPCPRSGGDMVNGGRYQLTSASMRLNACFKQPLYFETSANVLLL